MLLVLVMPGAPPCLSGNCVHHSYSQSGQAYPRRGQALTPSEQLYPQSLPPHPQTAQPQPPMSSHPFDMHTHHPTAGANALLSLAAGRDNNVNRTVVSTSGFSCRTVAASETPASVHSYERTLQVPLHPPAPGISAHLMTAGAGSAAQCPRRPDSPYYYEAPPDGGGSDNEVDSPENVNANQVNGIAREGNAGVSAPPCVVPMAPLRVPSVTPTSDSTDVRGVPKRKRPSVTGISHAQKRRLCEMSLEHPDLNHASLAKMFCERTGRNIERSTVSRVLQRKDVWMKADTSSLRKRLVRPKFPTVDEALCELIRHRSVASCNRTRLSDRVLIKESKDIASILQAEHGSLDSKSPNFAPLLGSFRGSISWVKSFKQKNKFVPANDMQVSIVDPAAPTASFSSTSMIDPWPTDFDTKLTKEVISNCPRLQDLYFLEATVLAPNALPEHAVMPPPPQGAMTVSRDSPEFEDFLFGTPLQAMAAAPDELGGHALRNLRNLHFGSTGTIGASGLPSRQANGNDRGGDDANGYFGNRRGRATSTMDSLHGVLRPSRHNIDEESLVVALLGANGTGLDRVPPWVIGKQPLQFPGARDGHSWSDCDARYFYNMQGWLTARIVRKWVQDLDERVGRSVVLVTSLLNYADVEILKLKMVTVIPLPRSQDIDDYSCMGRSICRFSPMSHGIEDVFRAKYRCSVVDRALSFLKRGEGIKAISTRSVVKLVKQAWGQIPLTLVRRAWRDLSYLPSKLQAAGPPCKVSSRSLVEKRVEELDVRIRNYRSAILTSPSSQRLGVLVQDVQVALDEPKMYMWLQTEQAVFHPKAHTGDIVRSIISDGDVAEVSSDAETPALQATSFCPAIQDYEGALHAVNRLAEFSRTDAEMSGGRSLYLISSLQLEIKRRHEQRLHALQTKEWSLENTSPSAENSSS